MTGVDLIRVGKTASRVEYGSRVYIVHALMRPRIRYSSLLQSHKKPAPPPPPPPTRKHRNCHVNARSRIKPKPKWLLQWFRVTSADPRHLGGEGPSKLLAEGFGFGDWGFVFGSWGFHGVLPWTPKVVPLGLGTILKHPLREDKEYIKRTLRGTSSGVQVQELGDSGFSFESSEVWRH